MCILVVHSTYCAFLHYLVEIIPGAARQAEGLAGCGHS